MEFPKSVSINACEKFLDKLATNEGTDFLQLPVATARYAFGGLASAIQAANTWVRLSKNRSLALRPSSSEGEIEELINRPHKFVAAMSAKSIVRLDRPDTELRPQVNAAAKSAIENQSANQYGQQRGGLCWFVFVDHSSKGFDRNFYIEKYDANPEPRQFEQFKAVIRAMVDKAMVVAGGAKPLERDSLDHLGRIFYELFLNTHEHGTRGSSRSDWLKPGVRVIYVQSINLTEVGAKGATKKQPILSDYLRSVANKHAMGSKKRFVEIGIVDSGLGYCGRWLADDSSAQDHAGTSIANEYEIFKKCFGFRQTSTTKNNKGIGLPVVMDRLTKLDGFMRIRSGRLALYRDFLTSPYVPNDVCVFSDWHSGQIANQTLTPMPSTAGVAITLLIPLEAKS